jgi:hypothetical protein
MQENEHLREEIENWKSRDAANTKLWKQNYEQLKQHLHVIERRELNG